MPSLADATAAYLGSRAVDALLFGGVSALNVADFFVDPAGSDANDGTTPATAFRTLSKLQSSLTAGKTALLKRGGRWKETISLPADGITLGAYGPAATVDADGYVTNAPVIDGGEYVTGWSSYSGGVSDSYVTDNFAGTSGANLSTSTPEVGSGSWSAVLSTPSLVISSDGMARRSTTGIHQAAFSGAPPQPDYYVETVIKVKSLLSVDGVHNCVRMNPSGQGSDSMLYSCLVVSAGSTFLRIGMYDHNVNSFHDLAPFALAAGDVVTLRSEVEGTVLRTYLNGALVDTYDFTGTFFDTFQESAGQVGIRMGFTSSAAGTDTTGFQVDSIDAGPLGSGTPVNTYQATLAADPKIVELRGEYALEGSGVNVLDDGEYSYESGKLYVRSDSGQPNDTDVVAGARDNAVVCGTHGGITLRGVAAEHTRDHAISWTGGSNGKLSGVMVQRAGGALGNNGVVAAQNHTGLTLTGCVIRECGTDGLYMSACPDHVVTNCRIGPVFGPNADPVQHDSATGATVNGTYSGNVFLGSPTSPKGLLILFGDTYTIEGNYFEGGTNFHIATFGNHVEVSGNVFYDCQSAIAGAGGAFEITDNVATAVTDYDVHHNVFIDCNPAINVWSAGTAKRSDLRFYANTIVNVGVAPDQWQVNFQEAVSGEFKDNIVWDATGTGKALQFASVASGETWVSDFNDLGPEAAGFIHHLGSTYDTLAAYKAGASQDAHSINSDPLFANPGGHAEDGSDYALQVGSPALTAGVVVPGIVLGPRIGAK